MENLKNKSIAVDRLVAASYLLAMIAVGMIILMALGAMGQSRYSLTGDPAFFDNYSLQVSKVRSVYTSQIGVREKQPNSGREVEQYLRYVNLPKGNPWCAAFVCWVFGQANIVNPRTGWSPDLFLTSKVIWAAGDPRTNLPAGQAGSQEPRFPQNAKEDQGTSLPAGQAGIKEKRRPQNGLGSFPSRLITNNQQLTTPSHGDIFGLYFPEKKRIAHVGFIEEWNDPWVTTVEGNTNVLGSREGDGVYRKRRLVRSIYKVARYVE